MKKNEGVNARMRKRKNYSGNVKSDKSHYNPTLIKKQKEFYKNAKNIKKFKKMLKQQTEQTDPSSAQKLMIENDGAVMKENKGESEKRRNGLEELYRKKHEEKERERMEREAALMAKKEEREEAQARRKALRDKMLKKTRKGQPLMKYRIQHLLDTIQVSTQIKPSKSP
ncbi:hypothetical protein HN51_015008 [Arachis hypogaea]|uniref:rRNA-processing protein FYV7 n=1 Tax=Arachis hypogaea TaxID=3818 RepID=A0A445CMA6_ARAHY|nr:DNA ligase 1 isoform X1 [Arachis hypogaea]RYR52056.1 hypothetical protein Ahy_A06g026981 [Arachis hypogaea]